MRRPSTLTALALAGLVSLTLAACNDDGGDRHDREDRDDRGPGAGATPDGDPVQFRRVLQTTGQPAAPGLGETSAPAAQPTDPLPEDCAAVADGQPDAAAGAIACDDDGLVYRLAPAEIVGGVEDADATMADGSPSWQVLIELDDAATETFEALSTELAGTQQQFAILVDGDVVSAPVISTPITDGKVQVSGSFDLAAAQELAGELQQ